MLQNYLQSICVTAVICAIAGSILGGKSFTSGIIKIISGVFLLITLISPLMAVRIRDVEEYFRDVQFQSQNAANTGAEMASEELKERIIKNSQAYILEEAVRLELDVDVEVKLSDDVPPKPCQVKIIGEVSPYKKTVLSSYIVNHLGIPMENQQWM